MNRDVVAFCEDPTGYFDRDLTAFQTQPREAYERLQLEGLKYRFGQLRDTLPMLTRLADSIGITQIDRFEDVIPLLFDHTTYKSYPASFLHNGRFDQLTRWLGKLTTLDLSSVDVSHCDSIDSWLDALKDQTDLGVFHTSGTSGSFSLIPRTQSEWKKMVRLLTDLYFPKFGESGRSPELPTKIHLIYPYFRGGHYAHTLFQEYAVPLLCNGDERYFHTAYTTKLSSDLMMLSGRIQAAKSRGELDRLDLPPSVLARQQEFLEQQKNAPQQMAQFLQDMTRSLKGQRVLIQGATPMMLNLARQGLEAGNHGVFAPDSIAITAGGGKGVVLPDNWQGTVKEFLGIDNLTVGYAMSEVNGLMPLCSHNRYHLLPSLISFVLDPESGEPLPRHGLVTGRYACFDLVPDTRWGGFISGDEVTIDWDSYCPCGRSTPHLAATVQRYSEKQGGDDKITCAQTAEAYEESLEFLNTF